MSSLENNTTALGRIIQDITDRPRKGVAGAGSAAEFLSFTEADLENARVRAEKRRHRWRRLSSWLEKRGLWRAVVDVRTKESHLILRIENALDEKRREA